jgi:hypothetical protein
MYESNPSYRGVEISPEYKERVRSPDWMPRHFVVSVERATARRESMRRKLTRAGLDFTLVDAFTPNHPTIVTYYGRGRNLNGRWGCGSRMGPVICCMASHFKALKTLIESGEEIGVILEDDVLFRKDYKERMRALMMKYVDAAQFPTLISFFGQDGKTDDILDGMNKTWSTIGYIITKKYAEHVIHIYDRPHVELDKIIRTDGIKTVLDPYGGSSEIVTMKSGGLVVSVPMVIEDRQVHPSLVGNGPLNWSKYGLDNYVKDSP